MKRRIRPPSGTSHSIGRVALSALTALIAVELAFAPDAHADAQSGEASQSAEALDALGQWPSYNNGLKGQRFSPLTAINTKNVESLKEACRLKVADGGSLQTGPVVVDGSMYVTTTLDTFSIDPTNCKVRWKFSYQAEYPVAYPHNRGVAVMNGRVFRGTPDGRLLALDAATGRVIWKNVVTDPSLNEFLDGAPLAWNGLVIIGTTGGDFGIKGRVLAYDAHTGRELWRFTTIPTGNEVGAETWKNRETAQTGGGGTWSTFALDVITGELFVPVGNPAPGFAPQFRPGANLFTDSMVVLDVFTGHLKWWYQLEPNDGHDLDIAAAPMLYTNGEGRDVVAIASKDGYVYVLDRLTHEQLFKRAVTTIENAEVAASEKETRFCPGAAGGTEWNGPAFDSMRRTIFVGAVDDCSLVTATHQTQFKKAEGVRLSGAAVKHVTDVPPSGWLYALDSDSGQERWKYHANAPIIGGVTATAGGVTFTGDTAGTFLALDSANGRVLYKDPTGGAIAGGVITYSIGRRQYVAFTSGNVSRYLPGAVGVPTIIILTLPEGATAGSHAEAAYEHGRELYVQNCSVCHGPNGESVPGKSLKNLHERLSFDATVEAIQNPKPPMPKLYPSPLGSVAIRDIASYIRTF